jgi:hypothetical protein
MNIYKCDDVKINEPIQFLGLTEDFLELKKSNDFIPEQSTFIGLDIYFYSIYYDKKWHPDFILCPDEIILT